MMSSCMSTRSSGPRCYQRTASRSAVVVRAQSCGVTFKIHRHVEFGQCLQLVGSSAELGAWNPANAVGLNWSTGDVWTADVEIPAGTALEYKYIIKRKEGLDWCPGSNKAVSVPTAAAAEVKDAWDSGATAVTILAEAAAADLVAAPEATSEAVSEPVTPAMEVVATAVEEEEAPAPSTAAQEEAYASANGQPITVSTVENVLLEDVLPTPAVTTAAAPAEAAPARSPSPSPVLAANNIVQAPAPIGGFALSAAAAGAASAAGNGNGNGSEAPSGGKDEVYEVRYQAGGGSAVALAPEATAAPATTAKASSFDSLTVSELRTELRRRGQMTFGTRRELIARLMGSGGM